MKNNYKNFHNLAFSLIIFFVSSAAFGQVGPWPPNSQYYHFGAPELGQANYTKYALLQDKIDGSTFLNSPLTIYFRIGNSDKMILANSGYFGIGTSSPISLLHVNSSTPDVLRIQNAVGGFGNKAGIDFSTFPGSGKVARIEAIDQGNFNGDLTFYTDGDNTNNSNVVERLRITSQGYIGIGTSSPNSKLHIDVANNNPEVPAFTIGNTESGKNYSGVFEFRSPSTTAPFYIYSWDDELQFSQRNANGTYKSQYMKFHNQTGHVTFPNATGNVGIGTETPDSKLTVKGIIHTQEVKVDLNGSVAPDYVFEKDYPLTSLEELKTYIDQNKHLPEVPSAKEMEEEGINLKEMNLLLLKKVEELTLHLIELKKEKTYEINLLQSQIDQLKGK